ENTDSLIEELNSMGVGITETEYTVEAALGNIINDLSKKNTGGTITERMRAFNDKVNEWVSLNFPMTDKGITAKITDYKIDLNVEILKLSSGDKLTDPSRPSYLKATGYINVDFISGTGTTSKIIDISADGTSGLPFIVERASEFELSVSGDESAFTQLISYQLSSLAQQRVLSGYGAISEGGERGTLSIITEKDVRDAYRNSLSIIEMICFRNTGDNNTILESAAKVDAADMLAMRDGYIEMDLAAIFSQTLLSMTDTLVLQWMDYLMLDKLVNAIDTISDSMRRCWNALVSFISSENPADAGQYLMDIMQDLGYNEEDYRFLLKNLSTSIKTESMVFSLIAGPSSENITIPAMEIVIPYPESDIVSWSKWDNFINEYHGERNDLMETFRGIIKTIAIKLSSSTDLGIIRICANAYDDTTFSKTLSESITKALNEQWDDLEICIEGTIRDTSISDPLFIAMYEKIQECRNEIYNISEFEKTVRSSIKTSITEYLNDNYGTALDSVFIDNVVDKILKSKQTSDILTEYNEEVNSRVKLFEKVLTQVPKDDESMIKDILVKVARGGMCAFDLYPIVESQMNKLCQEVISYNDMNSFSGLTELGDTKSFTLYDNNENIYEEFMKVKDSSNISVKIVAPEKNTDKCIHYVGFEDHNIASYTSVFSVNIKAIVNYNVASSSAVLSALETYDATFEDSISLDTTIDIPCMSGWALTGVEYKSSTNFLNDAWQLLLKALEPLLEPLRKVYRMLQDLFSICGTAIIEISDYVSELVMKFYEAIEEPMAIIQKFIDDTLQDLVDNIGLGMVNIGLASQSVELEYYGMKLTIETKLATLVKNTKTLVKITLTKTVNNTDLSASVELRENLEDGFIFIGNGSAKANDWNIDLSLDPLMKIGSTLIEMNGKIRNVEFEAVMPQLVQYEEIGINISDIPGIGSVLSNIPLPIPGIKGSLDMGLELKYNLPIKTGLIINEFESNPAGSDNGTEWVELLNSTNKAIDLKNYVLVPGSSEKKTFTIEDLVLPAGGKTVIIFDKQTLNNSKSGEKSGDRVTLLDPNGKEIDQTPWKSDSSNSDYTWQRSVDGYTEWTFAKGTPGSKNGGSIPGGVLMRAFIIDCFRSAGEKAFEEMSSKIKNADDLALFMQRVIEIAFEEIIESIANSIVSASAFIELEITDYAETQHNGIRISLEIGSEMIEDSLKWLISQIGCLAKYIDTSNNLKPAEFVCEDTYFRTMVYTGISAPQFLNITSLDTKVLIGVSVSVNIAGICNVFGKDMGKWKANIGIVMENIPTMMVPPLFEADKTMKSDLWLLKVNFQEADD
ncbi:MAG: lamin tail domain-containing protein, partial [Candidatus Methanomethylophilaceae archaeon]